MVTRSLCFVALATYKPLTPKDYDVDSIARECEDHHRGNKCEMDGNDPMGITCYITCDTDLCNNFTRKPVWSDFQGQLGSSSGDGFEKEDSNAIDPPENHQKQHAIGQRRGDERPYPFYNAGLESNEIRLDPDGKDSGSEFQGPRSFQGQEERGRASIGDIMIGHPRGPMEGGFDNSFEYEYESGLPNKEDNNILKTSEEDGSSKSYDVMEKNGADKKTKSDDLRREGNKGKNRGKKGKSNDSSKSTLNQQMASSGIVLGNFWFAWLVGGSVAGAFRLLRGHWYDVV